MSGEAVLIVEDESVVALNVSHIVQSLGYRPIGPIASAKGALELLNEEPVDLVLMDIKLKGNMDGIELAKRINSRHPVPIVFLTAYADRRTLSRAKVVEPYGYITKSFDEDELHSTIEMALYKFKVSQKLVREERLLAATLDSVSEGVVTTDVQGRVQYMNQAAVQMLGVELALARGKKLGKLVTLRAGDGTVQSPLELDGSPSPNSTEETSVFSIFRNASPGISGPPVEWKATRTASLDNKDAEVVHVIRDLTTRFHAEAVQRRLVSVLEFSDDAIVTLGADGRIDSWNSGAVKVFGFSAREAVGRSISIIAPRSVPFELIEEVARVGAGEVVDPFEIVCMRRNGSFVDVAMKLQGVRNHASAIESISLIARDVTARKNLDRKLREILNREQTRIGQNLHDSIGQMITGVLFKTQVVEQTLRQKSFVSDADEIADVKEILQSTLLKLRELARGLIPATILSDGLVFALRRLAKDTESLCGLRIGFTADPGVDIADELVSTEVYHIVEEALNNSVKHSRCSSVAISVQAYPETVAVSIRDDGRGLPNRMNQNGLGLKIMRHRAELIGASFTVQSTRSGTEVICRVPTPVGMEK